jgi:catechol 2,3-dioxygenase-like lactoylglutathione lyase family enzyme
MIDHIYFPVSDLERSSEFYKKLLEPLGIDMPYKFDQLHGFAIMANIGDPDGYNIETSVRALGGECDVKVFGDFAILQPETRIAIKAPDLGPMLRRLVERPDLKLGM